MQLEDKNSTTQVKLDLYQSLGTKKPPRRAVGCVLSRLHQVVKQLEVANVKVNAKAAQLVLTSLFVSADLDG